MYTKSAGIRIFVLSTETLNFGPQLNVLVKNFSILPKHGEMILPPLTFMVNPTINLMRRESIILCTPRVLKNYSLLVRQLIVSGHKQFFPFC